MPKYQAAVAQMTMDANAPIKATDAAWGSPPKSTMLEMVTTTLVFIIVITKTPRKLKTAAMMIALRGFMARVPMAVAMALGASVQPLTNMTPMVNMVVMMRAGLENSDCSVSNVCTFDVVLVIVNYILQIMWNTTRFIKFS